MAVSTNQAERLADHGARLTNLEVANVMQNDKLDALAAAVAQLRVDLAALPGEILRLTEVAWRDAEERVNSSVTKAAVGVILVLIGNAVAWWFKT